jgi:hypothetical protein
MNRWPNNGNPTQSGSTFTCAVCGERFDHEAWILVEATTESNLLE